MPRELRFCRNCGYRLGEGSAEYTETVRFKNGGPAVQSGRSTASYGLSGGPLAPAAASHLGKRRKPMSGMAWMFLGLLIFFVAAAGFTALVTPIRRAARIQTMPPASPRSFVGVNSFDTAEGGVTFDTIDAPGSPADKAGLVGGDIITSFDGQRVQTDDEIMDLLGRTEIGKTVDVVFLRDGEQKTTKLTTVSRAEFDRLRKEFDRRPEGKGQFGYDDGNSERVPIPGTKIFGVRLDKIHQSRPADLAGIKEGDIVTEFDGIPIRTPKELRWRVRRALPYSTVKVVVIRGSEKLEIPVKMGKE